MKKGIKVLLIVLGVIIILGLVFFAIDYNRVQKQEKPLFCIQHPAGVIMDGGTVEYFGLGYKVIKYNQKVGRRDTVIGSWSIKYNTTPETYTIRELAYSIINDNNNHVGEFIRLTGTISSKSNKNNTITLKFSDDIEGKYDLTVKAELLSKNIKELNKMLLFLLLV